MVMPLAVQIQGENCRCGQVGEVRLTLTPQDDTTLEIVDEEGQKQRADEVFFYLCWVCTAQTLADVLTGIVPDPS